MSEVMVWVWNNGQSVIEGLIAVVGGFAMLATLTPNKSDDAIVQRVLDMINFLAANFGKSANDPAQQ